MNEETNNVSEESNKEDSNKKQSLPLWRRIALALIVLAMIGLGGLMLAGFAIEKMLGSKIEAISKAGYPVSFTELAGSGEEITTEDAGPIYTDMITKLSTEDMQNMLQASRFYRSVITAGTMDKLPKELQQSVAQSLTQSKPLMTDLDKAATLPISGFDIGIQNGREFCVKRVQQAQKALSFLSLRTLFLIGVKDYDRAAMSIISMLKGTRVFNTHPIVAAANVKNYFLRLACDDIRLLIQNGKISDEMLDKLITALTETATADELQRTFLAEQVYQMEATRNIIPESTILKIMAQELPEIPERVPLPASSLGRTRVRLFVLDYFKEMDGLVTAAAQAWPGPFDYAMENKDKVPGKLEKNFKVLYAFVEFAASSTAAVRETVLMFHVEKHRRANGSVPESLEQIAKDIDPAILTDPYTGGKLTYKKEDQSYLIYSAGPDKIDNGGDIAGKISETTGKIEKMPEDIGLRIVTSTEE